MRALAMVIVAWLMLVASPARADESGYRLANAIGIGSALAIVPVGPVFIAVGTSILGGQEYDRGGRPIPSPGRTTAGVGFVAVGGSVMAVGAGGLFVSAFAGYASLRDMGRRPTLAPGIIGAVGLGAAGLGVVVALGDPDLGGALAAASLIALGGGTAIVGSGVQLLVNAHVFNRKPPKERRSRRSSLRMGLAPQVNGLQLFGAF